MTQTVKIISDSTCDLSKDLLEKYDISILPLHILLGETEYRDGVDITPEEIFRWSDENKTTPKTSAPSMTEAMEVMKPFLDEGREIICFSISDSMSTSGNVMRLAAEELEVTVINSANLSTGIGLQVIQAALLSAEGKTRAQITAAIEEIRPRVRASFTVDTLTYLYRGGRCNAVAALAGTMLKLHPRIVVEDGAMDASKKYRGKLSSVILSYTKDMEDDLKNAVPDRVFITHSGVPEEIIETAKEAVRQYQNFEEICVTRAGCTVSSHCGPGTIGVLFLHER